MTTTQRLTKLTVDDLLAVPASELKGVQDYANTWNLKGYDMKKLSIFEYHGFDPTLVYAYIYLRGGEMLDNGKSVDDLKEEVIHIIACGVIKGNFSTKSIDGLSEEGKKRVNYLYDEWALDKRVDRANIQASMTMARFAIAFPLQSAIISRSVGRPFTGPFESSGLPRMMRTSSFISLIPQGMKITNFLMSACNAYSSDLSAVVKGATYIEELTAEKKKALWVAQMNFTRTSLHSGVIGKKQREHAVVFLELENHWKEIHDVVIQVSPDAVITEALWDADMATIQANAAGALRADPGMPSAAKMAYLSAVGITDKEEDLRLGMKRSNRLLNASQPAFEREFVALYGSITAVPQVHDGVPWELYKNGEDISDISDRTKFLADTDTYLDGWVDMTGQEFGAKLVGDVLGDWVQVGIDEGQFALTDQMSPTTGPAVTLGTALAHIRQPGLGPVQKFKFVATGDELEVVIVRHYLAEANKRGQERMRETNRMLYFLSSLDRRQKVRIHLGLP